MPEQNSPVPQAVENQRLVGKTSVKDRITRKFKHQSARKTLEDLVKVPDHIPEEAITPNTETPSLFDTSLSPEIQYQRLVDNLKPFNAQSAYKDLKHAVEDKMRVDQDSNQQPNRAFTYQDRLRHKSLEVVARSQGVKDMEGFRDLVKQFEKTTTTTQYRTEYFKEEPSDVQKEQILKNWEQKGYKATIYDFQMTYDEANGCQLSLHRDIPVNIGRRDVGAIKKILESGNNPVESIKVLQKLGFSFAPKYLEGEELDRFTALVELAGEEKNLQFLEGFAQLPHLEYFSVYSSGSADTERLLDMLKDGTATEYSTDFFEKANVLIRACGTHTDLGGISSMRKVIESDAVFEFLVTALVKGYTGEYGRHELIRFASALSNSGLMKETTTAMQADLELGRNYQGIAGVEIHLLAQYLHRPESEAIIENLQMQIFARVTASIAERHVDAKLVAELFPNRDAFVSVYGLFTENNLIVPNDARERRPYVKLAFDEIVPLFQDKDIRDVLINPEFPDFIRDLLARGVTFEPLIDKDSYRYDKKELFTLFKVRDAVKYAGDDIYSLASYLKNDTPDYEARSKIFNYMVLAKNMGFILELDRLGVVPKEKLLDGEFIESFKVCPFMQESIRDQIPLAQQEEWVENALNIPYSLQSSLLSTNAYGNWFQHEDRNKTLSAETLSKVEALGRMYREIDMLKESSFGFEQILVGYPNPSELFADGKPTRLLTDYMISKKKFTELERMVDIPGVRDLLTPEVAENIDFFKKIGQVKFVLGQDPAFPHLTPEQFEKYDRLADICKYPQNSYASLSTEIANSILTYGGDLEELFSNGKPTALLINRLIAQKQLNPASVLLTGEVLDLFGENRREALRQWKSLPTGIKEFGAQFIHEGVDEQRLQDGIGFFKPFNSDIGFALNKQLDQRLGYLMPDPDFNPTLSLHISTAQRRFADAQLTQNVDINLENWKSLLMTYAELDAGLMPISMLSEGNAEKLNELFKSTKAKDKCLKELRAEWTSFLESGESTMPFTLKFLIGYLHYTEGAGPLTQVNTLSELMYSVDHAFSLPSANDMTRQEMIHGLSDLERMFSKDKWSNDERSNFYTITSDVLNISSELFSDYLSLFSNLNSSQMKQFSKDIYPLYKTKFTFLEKSTRHGGRSFDGEDILRVRREVRELNQTIQTEEDPFSLIRNRLLTDVKGLFRERLGIIKVPDSLTTENIRSLTDVSLYIANISVKDPKNEAILAFYLGLEMDGKWQEFRRGVDIDPKEYLSEDRAVILEDLLQERRRLDPLTPKRLGIADEDLGVFQELLQSEAQNVAVGSVETIDIKMTNIVQNLRELEDLDLYPDPLDKERLKLLTTWGNKSVGSVIARMYQGITNPGKEIKFSESELEVKTEIERVIAENGLTLTTDTLKTQFQDQMKPLATIVNILTYIDESGAENEVGALQKLIVPSEDITSIFRRLGEDFQPESGAMALSQDLDYLENLMVKKEADLNTAEKQILTDYLNQIRGQMISLEKIYDQVKNKFGALKQGSGSTNNPLLTEKLSEIEKIINRQSTEQTIVSTFTNNLNDVIENIRECLSCKTVGINNDTNLTFGDSNKFFLYTTSNTQLRGSISDELVFVEPIRLPDGSQSVAFVLDRVYGIHSPTIVENHIDTLIKKYRQIKQRFPDINLKIFVTDSSITGNGLAPNVLAEKLVGRSIPAERTHANVDVATSAFSDSYIEFGGDTRQSGERNVAGILISI